MEKKKLYVILEKKPDWSAVVEEHLSNRAAVSSISTDILAYIKELVKQLRERDDFDVTFVRFDPDVIKEFDLEDMETAFRLGLEVRLVSDSE